MAKISNRKKNDRKRNAYQLGIVPQVICFNCGQKLNYGDGHFFPPSFGEKGFWICSNPLDSPSKTAKIG